jgi:putative peptidoglycan lipid II flippase
MLPRAVGLGANQILLLFFTGIASALSGSAVAVYNLADNIQTMPMVVFGTSFAMAIFPTLSEKSAEKDTEQFAYYFIKSLRSILFFMIPIVFGVYLLRQQIVRLILGSGHFGWSQTNDTASCLGFFALALVFTSVVPLLARAFYALHNTKIPMVITIFTVAVSVGLAYLLTPNEGVNGLAIAYSFGGFFNAVVLYLLLRSRIQFKEGTLALFIGKVLVSSSFMALAIWESISLTNIIFNMHRFWGVLAQTAVAFIIGLVVFLIFSWIFNCEEIASVQIVLARLTGRSLAEGTNEPGR